MPEALKHVYNRQFLMKLATGISEHYSSFRSKMFVSKVLSGNWAELELKARMYRISECLHEYLTGEFKQDVKILTKTALSLDKAGLNGFEYMLFPDYVEKYGMQDYATSISVLGKMTAVGSAEFAIRPFLIHYPERTLAQMMKWSLHKNKHLRRLSSEGCRPRLPWAMALPAFKKNPNPILPILETLRRDPSLYVRRSVANNLNDISKDNPALTLKTAEAWIGQHPDTDWVVKHACRGLLKQGDQAALKLFGHNAPTHITVSAVSFPGLVQFGNRAPFSFTLQSSIESLGNLRIEYAIDFMKSNGKTKRKVFKIGEGDYSETHKSIERHHIFVPISTRRHYNGKHGFALILNGVEVATRVFELAGV